MRSRSRPAPTRWSILALLALSLAGCAASRGAPPTQAAGLTIPVDASLREKCQHPPLPPRSVDLDGASTTTVGAIETFATQADTQLETCARAKAALVNLIDLHNAAVGHVSDQIVEAHKSWFAKLLH